MITERFIINKFIVIAEDIKNIFTKFDKMIFLINLLEKERN